MKVAVDGPTGMADPLAGVASRFTDALWRRRKPRQLAGWQPVTAGALLPGERPLAVAPGALAPNGPKRLLLYLSLYVAARWLVRRGVVTATDRRLIFHPLRWTGLRRRPAPGGPAWPLDELEVQEWYTGTLLEQRQRVLVLRLPDGRTTRLAMDRVWAEEAQLVFDLVASATARPPAVLATRWAMPGAAPVRARRSANPPRGGSVSAAGASASVRTRVMSGSSGRSSASSSG